MKNRLLIFAHDAGSANVTIAYASVYSSDYNEILAYPKGPAVKLYEQYINQYISKEKVEFFSDDTIVTGTSGIHSDYEMQILKKVKQFNIKKSISIVDCTANFNLRFTLDNRLLKEKYLPDEIWIHEENFIANVDYFNSKIYFKENIYNSFLTSLFVEGEPKINHPFIRKYTNEYLVILTEYIYEQYKFKFGFTEYSMLEDILKNISSLRLEIPIFLKLHPAEDKNKFNEILSRYTHLNIFQDECNTQELIYHSKVVFGIHTSVFKESILFEKPTYSVQINSNKSMKINILNQNSIIYTDIDLQKILNKEFKGSYI